MERDLPMNRRWTYLPAFCLGLALSACGGSSSSGGKTGTPIPVQYGDLMAVAYGNGVFVAAGDQNLGNRFFTWTTTSTDGVNWKSQGEPDADGPDKISSVAYGGAGFMATTELSGELFTSTDGLNWTEVTTVAENVLGDDVTWDGTEYILDGSSGFQTSTDGVGWSPLDMDTSNPFPQADQIVKVASVAYAPVSIPTGTPGMFTSGIGSSTDLVHWTVIYNAAAGVTLDRLFHVGSTFIALSAQDEVVTSPDGSTWTSQAVGSLPDLDQVVTNGSVYVGVDTRDSEVFYSHDGVTWTKSLDLPAPEVNSDSGLGFAAAAPGGLIVIVGGGRTNPYSFAGTDGIHWKQGAPRP